MNWLRKLFGGGGKNPTPGTLWESQAITNILKNGLAPQFHFTHDRLYRALPVKDFEQIIFDCWHPSDWPEYKAEIWDCDNFADAFAVSLRRRWAYLCKGHEALAFGVIVGYLDDRQALHAFIWQVDDRGLLHFYEPQNGGKRIHSTVRQTVRVDI